MVAAPGAASLRVMAVKQIVILGGGTGGTMTANRLRRRLDAGEAAIHVVDRDDRHVYQPGLLLVPFGLADARRITRPRRRQLRRGIRFHESEVAWVDLDARTVALADGARRFDRGRLVVNLVDMPIKCPVAPLEFAFLADWYLRRRGVRRDVEIAYVTPLDGAFTQPVASAALASLLTAKEIELVTEFNAGEVDGAGGVLTSFDGRTVDFDLLVTVPLHGGAAYVARSPRLGDALGFVPTKRDTLQTLADPSVFALGDAADVPTSKAGSVTHFEAEVLADNVVRHLAGATLDPAYDGHANCFVETGFRKALLIDFNYATEPLPGRFPTAVGPLSLLHESVSQPPRQ